MLNNVIEIKDPTGKVIMWSHVEEWKKMNDWWESRLYKCKKGLKRQHNVK